MKKIPKFSMLLYIFLENYLLFTYLFIPLLINSYKQLAYLVPLIFIFISILLVILLPKKMNEINYEKIINKSIVLKIIYVISLIITYLLQIIIGTHVILSVFFPEFDDIVFLIAFILLAILISKNKFEVIINSSTMLFIIAIITLILPVFFSSNVRDYTLLLPFELESKSLIFILFLYFILDSINKVIYFNKTNKINKWQLVIPIILMCVYFSYEIFINIITLGTSYLNDNDFLGYFTIYIQDAITYIGNVIFIYEYVIPLVVIYKSSFALNKIKDCLNIKDNKIINMIIFALTLLICILTLLHLNIQMLTFYMIFVLTVIYSLIYMFILINRSPNYEIKF